jgi:hypothetical protein
MRVGSKLLWLRLSERISGRCTIYLSSASRSSHLGGIKENTVTHAGSPRGVTPLMSADSQRQERDGVSHHYKTIRLDERINARKGSNNVRSTRGMRMP